MNGQVVGVLVVVFVAGMCWCDRVNGYDGCGVVVYVCIGILWCITYYGALLVAYKRRFFIRVVLTSALYHSDSLWCLW